VGDLANGKVHAGGHAVVITHGVVITHAQPFGKRLAFCSYNPGTLGRTIALNVPKDHGSLLADNNTLLHEMVHQLLFERSEAAGHDTDGWRREIMRLNKLITGKEIWAGRSMKKRVEGGDGKLSKVVRVNETRADGVPSLGQMQIARWPHDGSGIDLGHLGEVTPSNRLPGGRIKARRQAGRGWVAP
jgi:hypothetical protein